MDNMAGPTLEAATAHVQERGPLPVGIPSTRTAEASISSWFLTSMVIIKFTNISSISPSIYARIFLAARRNTYISGST